MSDIYLIRHGQASFGEDHYDRLSAVGLRQAQVTGRHFARAGRGFDALYCGGLERQRRSALECCESCRRSGLALPAPVESAAFDEYDSQAVWQGLLPAVLDADPGLEQDGENFRTDRGAFQRLFARVMARWLLGGEDRPGMPRWADFKRRVRQGLEQVMAAEGPKKTLAVFTSGGPIAVAVQMALPISDQSTLELSWQLMNASITRLKYSRRGLALAGFNEVAHLELERDPSLLTYR
jgi:broad specificity phosphatase PhoE